MLSRQVFRGLCHRVHAMQRLHPRIDEAPAERRVLELLLARVRRVGLAEHVRCPGHALDPAGDHHVGLAEGTGPRRLAQRFEPGCTEAVYGYARYRGRQAREQRGHARDVAVVLARLIGAAEVDVVDGGGVELRMTLQQAPDRQRGEIVGAYRAQATAKSAEGRAQAVAQIRVCRAHRDTGGRLLAGRQRSIAVAVARSSGSTSRSA